MYTNNANPAYSHATASQRYRTDRKGETCSLKIYSNLLAYSCPTKKPMKEEAYMTARKHLLDNVYPDYHVDNYVKMFYVSITDLLSSCRWRWSQTLNAQYVPYQ